MFRRYKSRSWVSKYEREYGDLQMRYLLQNHDGSRDLGPSARPTIDADLTPVSSKTLVAGAASADLDGMSFEV